MAKRPLKAPEPPLGEAKCAEFSKSAKQLVKLVNEMEIFGRARVEVKITYPGGSKIEMDTGTVAIRAERIACRKQMEEAHDI